MRQRLKTDFVSDFADAEVWVEQQILGFLNPHARNVIREVKPRRFLEEFAEIERARVDSLGDQPQRNLLSLVSVDELFCPGNYRQFGVRLLNKNLVAYHREVLSKNCQQPDNRAVLF